MLYEQTQSQMKVEGGISVFSMSDVSSNASRSIGATVENICNPSLNRYRYHYLPQISSSPFYSDRRLCSFLVKLPTVSSSSQPPTFNFKLSGFSLSLDSSLLPFLDANKPAVASATVPQEKQVQSSELPFLHSIVCHNIF